MYAFDMSFQRELARTTWTFYSIGIAVIALRTYGQIHRLGIKGLKLDDYLMFLAASFYTILIVCLNIIAMGGGSNLFEPDELSTFSPEEIKERKYGSKIVIVSEQAMLNVIYTLKICILLMYRRLTAGTERGRAIKYLFCYVAIGWTATEIAFFTACRPFRGYWAVPPPNPQCTTLQHYAIIQGCFNITGDLMMIFIPLPMIASLQLPLKQKIMLSVVFSMGFFVIAAAILTKVFNLSNVYDTAYMLWYTREASVAVYVANMPMIWPLLREWVPCLRTGIARSNESDLPRYITHGTLQSGVPSNKRHLSTYETDLITDDKEVSIETQSLGNGASREASTPPARISGELMPVIHFTSSAEQRLAALQLDFGFSNPAARHPRHRALSTSLSPVPDSHDALGNSWSIHAQTTIEVQSCTDEGVATDEKAAGEFDATAAKVTIKGGSNEPKKLVPAKGHW